MKAIVIAGQGGPESLEIRDLPEPRPAEGEELVRVQSAGINFADTMAASGHYPGMPQPPVVAGREFCGLPACGGAMVMGYVQWGAFAEVVSARSGLLWPLPRNWTPEEGAAFPVNFFTAYLAYWKAGLLETPARARVLIHAAAGGVGTAAVQIGKVLGLEMYGTSSADEKLNRMQELGLQHPINYKRQDYEQAVRDLTGGEGVDVVFEMLGGEHAAKSIRCLRDFGRLVVYGTASGQRAWLDPGSLYAKGTSVHGLWLTYLSRNHGLMQQAWKQLSLWIAEGRLRPLIGNILPMEKAAEAYKLLLERKNFGKVVLNIP
jgi:NADPH2:quinone reductase